MTTFVLGISLFLPAAGAALSLVQLAQVRALRRESRALAEALSRLASPLSIHRAESARRLAEARFYEARTTAVRIADLPTPESQRARGMIQVLRTIRADEEPPEELLERPSGFWPTHPGPSEQA
jgi:hypothetical protein